MKRSFIREILESINPETISFAGGLPDETLFPLEKLKESAGRVLSDPSVLQYSVSDGIRPLREKIAEFYNADGVPTDADNILVTAGSQQALYVIAKHFNGHRVVVEEPSYLGAVNIFKMNEMSMLPVRVWPDGPDMEDFRTSLYAANLAYLIPDFHNPASSCTSEEKRHAIGGLLNRLNGTLIEDAPYSELYFVEKKAGIYTYAPDKVLHLGSFSKTLSPAMRIGWVRGEKKLIRKLTMIKETIDLHSCGISQHIINDYLKDTDSFREHLKNLRREYRKKMEFFADTLLSTLPEFRFERPEGGMFIYGFLEGVDTYSLVQKCMEQKVVFVPGDQFYTNGRKTGEIRFNFTKASEEQIEKGLQIISEILRSS